jgi:hypothetical protein
MRILLRETPLKENRKEQGKLVVTQSEGEERSLGESTQDRYTVFRECPVRPLGNP